MARTVTAGAAARRERNRQEMREAILGAARRIVSEQGVDALTMRAIAQEIGYSAPALYEYFPSKEDLYGCLYFEGSGGFAQRMRLTLAALRPEASALERIEALGHAYRAYAHEQPELFRLVLGNPRPEFTEGFTPHDPKDPDDGELPEEKDAFGLLVDVARDGVERGEFAAMSPVTIAVAAWAAVHGFVSLELSGHVDGGNGPGSPPPSPEEGRQRRDQLFDALIRMTLFGMVRRQEHGPTSAAPSGATT